VARAGQPRAAGPGRGGALGGSLPRTRSDSLGAGSALYRREEHGRDDARDRKHRVLDDSDCPSFDEHLSRGGGVGLDAARRLGGPAVVEELEAAGLRGRGGAGFPTGTKWRTVTENRVPGVPLTVVVKIWLENTKDLRWVAVLLDKTPPPDPVDVPEPAAEAV